MNLAIQPDPEAYPDFNSFFTRALVPAVRPVAGGDHDLACPVDGRISEMGQIVKDRMFQAKGRDYSLISLLGGSKEHAALFENGSFATIYLSPRDYHRIHMPLHGTLREMTYVPGRLFSVSPSAVELIPGLFARNERLICLFDTNAGPMAMILVGALFVSGLETAWSGPITPPHGRNLRHWNYRKEQNNIALERGREMGRFNMGSTVILLFGHNRITWADTLSPTAPVQMGQRLGIFDSVERKDAL